MSRNIDKRTWGVLGKQQTYFSPQKQVEGKTKTPLNANAFDSWDAKRSRFKRVDGFENAIQQGGTVIGQQTPAPDVSPTPTPSFTPTQTNTPTTTTTNTPTPSSTPYILPFTPALWYDATNLGSIDYITSGGTDYVSAWRSIGTYQKTVTGTTTNTMPIWSGSSQMPGSPRIVRWNKSSNTALRQFLTQRFDMTPIPQSGITTFVVFANPGYTYGGTSDPNGLAFNLFIVSGNTTGGFNTPVAFNYNMFIGSISNGIQLTNTISGVQTNNVITNYSATSLENKFLYTQVSEFSNNRPYFELNQSGGTQPNTITATTVSPISSIALGIAFSNAGVISTGAVNPGIEIGEIMVFNRTLTPSEQEQVQDYLRDKWRYDEWNSPLPVPTATPTNTPTTTPTPSITPTNTNTPTQTTSPTPSASAIPSGTTEALIYLERVVQSGGTVDATASAATITLFTSIVSNGLWDKIDAFYPTLGGVAASHSINARENNSTIFDLVFNGGWTHSSAGMQPNGTNGYADTGFSPFGQIGNNNTSSLGVYVNLQGTVGDRIYDMGSNSSDTFLTEQFNITAKRTSGTGNNTLFDCGDYDPDTFGRTSTTSETSASGMTIGSARASNDRILYRNGSSIATQTGTRSMTYANRNLALGAQNTAGAIAYYSSNQYAFAFMGSGLTNTEIVNLSNIINTYQTSLGRNTY